MHLSLRLLALVWVAGAAPTPAEPRKWQVPAPKPYRVDYERMEAVKDVFQKSWDAYYETAFPCDTLKPLTQSHNNDRNGWGASAVDALSTAILMGSRDVIAQILDFIPLLDFDTAQGSVSLFETTIRYLGGLLSGYDLLTGPYKQYAFKTDAVKALLSQAEKLAGNLAVAFDTPSGLPENIIVFKPSPTIDRRGYTGLATAGTLILEWTRLSDLTGNPVWHGLAAKGESYLLNPTGGVAVENYFTTDGVWAGSNDIHIDPEPFPGLVGTSINTTDGKFLDSRGGWNGGCDSFYEYLIKMHLYDPTNSGLYRERWTVAADSSIRYLTSHPSSNPGLTFLSAFDGKELRFQSQHLACFDGGNFILGGLLLNSPQYINFGIALTHSCRAIYAGTATGIGPDMFAWQDNRLPPPAQSVATSYGPGETDTTAMKTSTSLLFDPIATALDHDLGNHAATAHGRPTDTATSDQPAPTKWMASNGAMIGQNAPPPPDQQAFYDLNGFWIVWSDYLLRPEVIESYYYAYRATGDTKYQDWAWEAFVAINTTCAVWTSSGAAKAESPLPKPSGSSDEYEPMPHEAVTPPPPYANYTKDTETSSTSRLLGYSSIYNVNLPLGGGSRDFMESFWFAEVLKYLYLIFAEDSEVQLNADNSNKWVFNTEAHPLRIPDIPMPR